MEKVFGATERHDSLIVHRSGKTVLIFGYGEENEQGYDFRHTFEHKPTKEEVLAVIVSHVNEQTDLKILTGYEWNGKKVWLSSENQFNFKAAYDLAVQSGGTMLPVTFKLGEDGDCNAVYHTFETMDDFTDFFSKAIQWVNGCIADGWKEKDSVDYEKLFGDE